jgi:hypothetical protein
VLLVVALLQHVVDVEASQVGPHLVQQRLTPGQEGEKAVTAGNASRVSAGCQQWMNVQSGVPPGRQRLTPGEVHAAGAARQQLLPLTRVKMHTKLSEVYIWLSSASPHGRAMAIARQRQQGQNSSNECCSAEQVEI